MVIVVAVIVGVLRLKFYLLSQGAVAEMRPMSDVPSLHREALKGILKICGLSYYSLS